MYNSLKKSLATLFYCIAALLTVEPAFAVTPFDYKPAGENIRTRWAAQVSPENARPEYPRPQMVRPDWKNLNGLWDYSITSESADAMGEAQGRILVPYPLESSLSGVGKRISIDEALWYKTTVEVPAGWDGKRILLHFDAVDWKAEVYLDGVKVGEHTGGFTAFSFDITDYLKNAALSVRTPGTGTGADEGKTSGNNLDNGKSCPACRKAVLEVKVWDPQDSEQYSIPRGKQVNAPEGIWYTPVTGIWQTVWMEAVSDKAYIADYNVLTDIVGEIVVDAEVVGKQEGDILKVEVFHPRKGYNPEKPGWHIFKKAKAKVKAGEKAALKIRRPKLWSPDSPYLYGIRLTVIRDGKAVDRVNAYTAIRKISAKKDYAGVKRLALNDNILFQFGPLDQGWWPDGLYTAPTAEAMLFDIVKTKELGFNMIRKHIKLEPSRWYYDCDREGILVWQDMPCIGEYADRNDWAQGTDVFGAGKDYAATPEQKTNYYKEWAEIIAQFKKFQSIVVWVPFNEAWGQFDTEKVVAFTRSQDSTRLVNAASGGNWVKGAGDIVDTHTYPYPRMRIVDLEKVNVLGEYGGIGRPVGGHVWDIGKKWGYVQFDDEKKVTDTYLTYIEDLINIKQNDYCAAAVYTQTTDVEGEVNGFYTYDREILKMDAEKVRAANLRLINMPIEPAVPLLRQTAFHYKDKAATGHDRNMEFHTLRNGNLIMQVADYGARILSLYAPDRDGVSDDVIVGYDSGEKYVHNEGERFLGPTVGRVANRIGGARFTLDGVTYRLPANNGTNTLHGGMYGVDKVFWKVTERTPSSITFSYTAPDGQDGFPGNLKMSLTYSLTENDELDIRYTAETDKATPVNLSNHAFFNLRGSLGGDILDHVVTIDADSITPVDENLIPSGELMPVEGTPFDFRTPHKIGERVNETHIQLQYGNGYDHNWVLSGASDGSMHRACKVFEPTTGRVLEIFTDQPGLQFYCGNFFPGTYAGKNGKNIEYRGALVFETQKFPDAVHHPEFPDIILRPGETYTHHSVYKFYTE